MIRDHQFMKIWANWRLYLDCENNIIRSPEIFYRLHVESRNTLYHEWLTSSFVYHLNICSAINIIMQ